jgi:phosphoglycolate phosphatase
MLQNYQHIIWDWNGTLLDDLSLSVDIMNSILTQRGLSPLSLDRYRDVFTFPVRDYYQSIGFDLVRESFDELSLEFVTKYKSRWHESSLYPQARVILEQIQDSGRSQSVLSAHHQETLAELVNTFDVTHLFQHLIGLENSQAISKIHQGKRLLAMLPHQASDVLLIGDTLHDAEVAEAIDVDCVLVAHGHQSKERLRRQGAPVVESLAELLASLER